MFPIRFPYLYGSFIIVDIPIFLAERKSALIDLQDVPCHVFVVCAKEGAKGLSKANLGVFKLQSVNALAALCRLYLFQQRLHWGDALTIAASRVESELIKVAQLALGGAIRVFLLRQRSEDGAYLLVDILLQHVERTETTVSSWKRMKLLPSTCRETVEIFRWFHTAVEVAKVKPRLRDIALCTCANDWCDSHHDHG